MEQLNENKIICHIVGLNPEDKQKIIEMCSKIKRYNLIDLDDINNKVLNDDEMNKLFKNYSKLKKSKNDKYKDLDKKMTKYWEENMVKKVYDLIPVKKKTILIGKNHHYRLLSRKVNFLVSNKFFIDSNCKEEVKKGIKYNLSTHHDDIINGTFPVEFIDYKHQLKKRQLFEDSYIKSGYTKIDVESVINILESNSKNKIKGKGLWISLQEPYNIGSKIYPNNKPIYAYIDPVLSLLNSFKNRENSYKFESKKVVSIEQKDVKKLKKARYLYYVSKEEFILAEAKNKHKYITQNPVIILEKEKIKNVYDKLIDLKLLN